MGQGDKDRVLDTKSMHELEQLTEQSVMPSFAPIIKVDILNFCSEAARLIHPELADKLLEKANSYIPASNYRYNTAGYLQHLQERVVTEEKLTIKNKFDEAGTDESLAFHLQQTQNFSTAELAKTVIGAAISPFRDFAKVFLSDDNATADNTQITTRPSTPSTKPDNNNNIM